MIGEVLNQIHDISDSSSESIRYRENGLNHQPGNMKPGRSGCHKKGSAGIQGLEKKILHMKEKSDKLVVSNYIDSVNPSDEVVCSKFVSEDKDKILEDVVKFSDKFIKPDTGEHPLATISTSLEMLQQFSKISQENVKQVDLSSDVPKNRILEVNIVQDRVSGYTLEEIKARTKAKIAFITKVLTKAKKYGLAKMTHEGYLKQKEPKLKKEHMSFINAFVSNQSGAVTIRRIREALLREFASLETLSISTIHKTLTRKMQFSKRKAAKRDKRAASSNTRKRVAPFAIEISRAVKNEEEIWSLDETAFWAGKDLLLRWHPKKQTLVVFQDSEDPIRVSAICAFCIDGRYLVRFVKGACTALIYADFLRKLGTIKIKQTALILEDNAAIHHSLVARAAAVGAGLESVFVPPYSPEYNYCEYNFAIIKARLYEFSHTTHDQLVRTVSNLLRKIKPDLQQRLFVGCIKNL